MSSRRRARVCVCAFGSLNSNEILARGAELSLNADLVALGLLDLAFDASRVSAAIISTDPTFDEELEQILPVESERHLLAFVVGLNDLVAFAVLAGLGGDLDLAVADRETDASGCGRRRSATCGERALRISSRSKVADMVVVLRHHHLVVRKCAGQLTRDQQPSFGLEIRCGSGPRQMRHRPCRG